MAEFVLPTALTEKLRSVPPSFGFNGLGAFVFYRTYSRVLGDGTAESWANVCDRVVNSCFSSLKRHAKTWDQGEMEQTAAEMWRRMYLMQWTPPGRGLWVAGTEAVEQKGGMAMYNCGLTATPDVDLTDPFTWLMDASMLGVGVGFRTDIGHRYTVHHPRVSGARFFTVPDTREGWVDSVRQLLNSYFNPDEYWVDFDYSHVRPAGAPIRTFGGTASGPGPLRNLHNRIRRILHRRLGGDLRVVDVADIQNAIGACVIAGNVRRSAEIAFGFNEPDFLDLKNPALNRDRLNEWGWTSNNSVICSVGDDYTDIAHRIVTNGTGEPGVLWLDNARRYSRFKDAPDDRDLNVQGTNPCGEISLWPRELCNLGEVHLQNHHDYADYRWTVYLTYLYCKSVTLIDIHDKGSDEVVKRNRRLGISQTGVKQFTHRHGYDTWLHWSDRIYTEMKEVDRNVSSWLGVPESIKLFTHKPSGSVSLLSGATSGLHDPVAPYVIKRVYVAKGSHLVDVADRARLPIVPVSGDTVAVEFPVYYGDLRSESEVPLREKFQVLADAAYWYEDNQGSYTATFSKSEADLIPTLLREYETKLKSISFLPETEQYYPAMPLEAISAEEYRRRVGAMGKLDFSGQADTPIGEVFCANGVCELPYLSEGT